ncbi:unnamed protein product [Prorocentrum cordatum]|uniref:Uncharacterized protein n=1 Tax=Prorocentrum cordatum TaxID=2364126 RepID=A0ABN9RHJ1_9DINO|nr:unnamed protein product [Polarella glacialis]
MASTDARYTDPETPFALADSGDVRLISFNWLVVLAASGKPLPRRQDLPPEAFIDVADLRAMHSALPAHVAAAVLPVLSISYCWIEARHPDAEGKQIEHIVKTLEPHAEKWREFFPDMGVFIDWCAIYQKDPELFDERETPEAKQAGAEAAAFIEALGAGRAFYGGTAYEESRTPAEKAAFRRALHETMDVWYAHQMITTLFATQLPHGYTGRAYERRGWTFFERSSSELIKPASAFVVEAGAPLHQGRFLWCMAIDSSADDENMGRGLPLVPRAFAEQLQHKQFTNNADASAVAELHRKTATSVLGGTTKLELDGVPMREGDGERIAQVLGLCGKIEKLSWCFVEMPALEVVGMLAAPVPSLRKLHLQKNALGEAGGRALAEALGRGATPQLQELGLDQNALGEAGGVALAEALGRGATPQLQSLHLCENALGEAGGAALAEALGRGRMRWARPAAWRWLRRSARAPRRSCSRSVLEGMRWARLAAGPWLRRSAGAQRRSCRSSVSTRMRGTVADLGENALGQAGGAALAGALGRGATPQLQSLGLRVNALGEAGGAALAEALGRGATPQLRSLGLGGNALGEAGGAALAEALGRGAPPQLQRLDLQQNALGEATGAALAEALGGGAMSQLQSLGLGENALGEAGGAALAEALGRGATPRLRRLVMDGNALGLPGAAALAAAISKGGLPSLEALDVERTRLTAEGRRLLGEAARATGGRLHVVYGDEPQVSQSACCALS